MTSFLADRRHFLGLVAAASATACLPAGLSRAGTATSLAPAYPAFGDHWNDFKDYDPERDPDAPFYRSHLRRAARIAPFAATQAHPGLDAHVSSASLVAPYLTIDGPGNDCNRQRYAIGTNSRVHLERAWQYQDIVVGWNSTGLVPNAALIDAAHRNGMRCLGTMFQPDKRMFNGTDLPPAEVARKLIKLVDYFGFDGYFVNFEGFTAQDASAVQDLIGLMQTQAHQAGLSDFHIQFYNGYTDARMVWPGSPHADGRPREADAPRADSMMIDQGWSNYGMTRGCCSGPPLKTLPLPADLGQGYDPMAIFYGLQLYPGPGYFGLIAPTVVTPNTSGKALGGLQIYSVEDGLRKMRRARLDQLRASTSLSTADKAELNRWTTPKTSRATWYDLHSRFWSGQSGNPARNNTPTPSQAAIYGPADAHKVYTDYETPPGKATDQIRLPITFGVANFITERSVIGALPFVTRFNTGEGDRFFSGGQKVASAPWFNLGIQDILPTWTWWTKPLHAPLDRDHGAPELLAVDYDFEDAWDGGASLRMSGKLGAKTATEVRLFKTRIAASSGLTIGLVAKGGQGGTAKVGLIFEDKPEATEWLTVKPGAPGKTGWWQWRQDLSRFAGRTLAAVSLGFESPAAAKAYHINIGELSLTDGTSAPLAKPDGFRIAAGRKAGDSQTAELRLQWAFDPSAAHYDLFAGDGMARQWLGRISGDSYYVAALPRSVGAKTTTVHLVPTAVNGAVSEAVVAIFDWDA